MKKFLALLLCVLTPLGLCSCSSKVKTEFCPDKKFDEYSNRRVEYFREFESKLSDIMDMTCYFDPDNKYDEENDYIKYTLSYEGDIGFPEICIKAGSEEVLINGCRTKEELIDSGWKFESEEIYDDSYYTTCFVERDTMIQTYCYEYGLNSGQFVDVFFDVEKGGSVTYDSEIVGFKSTAGIGKDVVIDGKITDAPSVEDIIGFYDYPNEIIWYQCEIYLIYKDRTENTLVFKIPYSRDDGVREFYYIFGDNFTDEIHFDS